MSIKAVLFDIDGTILRCNGAGRKAMLLAAEEVFGTSGVMETTDFQGRTDLMILFESLKPAGITEETIHENVPVLMELYFNHLKKHISKSKVEMMPGIPELLEALAASEDVIIGLLTGNFSGGAEIKLSHIDLNYHFSLGVYGDDTAIRNEMPAIARKKIKEKYNKDISFQDMIIIGDTIFDIECARKSGACSVAVGTGWTPKSLILSHEPDHYFDDLGNTKEVISTLIN